MVIFALLISSIQFVYQLEHDPIANGHNFNLKISDNGQREFITQNKNYSGELYNEIYNTHNELRMINSWMENYDPDYRNKVICADYFWPNIDKRINPEINDILSDSGVEYYIGLSSNLKLDNFETIATFKTRWSNIVIYKNIN